MDHAHRRRLFWMLFAAGAALRLAALALDAEPRFFLGDSQSYLSTRLGGWIPPDRSWTYGLALSWLLGLTRHLAAVEVLQCVLSALTIALAGWTVLRAGLPVRAGALLALALHLEPLAFFYERALLTETAGTAALIAGIALTVFALRSASLPASLAAAGSLLASVSLRTALLPTVLWIAGFAGVHAVWAGRTPGSRFPLRPPRGAGAALAAATIAGLAIYASITGHLTGRRASITPNGGFMLIGAVAPLLEPIDFTGTRLLDAGPLLDATRHREWDMRNAQIYGSGQVVDRLQRQLGDAQAAAAAMTAARAAIRRDPAGFARLARRQAAEYFDRALYLARLPYWAGLDRPLPADLVEDLRRRVADAPAAASPAVPSPALAYLKWSANYLPVLVTAAIAVSLSGLGLLPLVPPKRRPDLALIAGALLVYLGSVFAFSPELAPRYLFPLVPLVALAGGLLAAGLSQPGVPPPCEAKGTVSAVTGSRDRHRGSRTATAGGVAVAAATTALLGFFGARKAVWYDDFWHVFIARQEQWRDFWQEVLLNAHPPVFYLLLKGAIALLGNSFLAYRAVSIAAIAVSIVLFSRLAARVTGNPILAVLGAAAFGLSAPILEIGLEVRHYAVFLAFLLVSLSGYLDWLGAAPGRAPWQARARFAGGLSLALLTHYSGFFFFGAAIAAPAALFLVHPRWAVRLRRDVRQHRAAIAAMIGAPLAIAAATYLVHVRTWAQKLNHVPHFVYDPGLESPLAFVARTTGSLARLFLPEVGPRGLAVVLPVAGLLAAGFWLAARKRSRGRLAAVPFVLLLLLIPANILAALKGRYPFGGEMRHEIFLLPIAVLCLFAGLERARRAAPARWSSRGPWNAAAALGVGAVGLLGIAKLPVNTAPLSGEQLVSFRSSFGRPPAILVDQFNFVVLFGNFHEWRWRLRWQNPQLRLWQVWDVSRGGEHFAVCRDLEWQSDLSHPAFYDDVADCLARAGVDRVALFRPQQGLFSPQWPREQTNALAVELGEKAGVFPDPLIVQGLDVYASFRLTDELGAAKRMTIVDATYGGNCGAARGNATALVNDRCGGRPACVFRVDIGAIGDPAPGCPKDFEATWRCGDEPALRRAAAAPEAGYGSTVRLGCDDSALRLDKP